MKCDTITQGDSTAPQRLTRVAICGSLVLTAGLLITYRVFGSQLVLAQAADSFSDVMGGVALLWAVHVSHRPADEEHPHGHSLAQPVAALVVAVLSGVLVAEVMRAALLALATGSHPDLAWPVAVVVAAKIAFKAGSAAVAGRLLEQRRNPVIAALRMDARNDVLIGTLSLLGLLSEHAGLPRMDAALAIGVAFYIAYSSLRLGRENISLLLGESASRERRQQLMSLARGVPGVQEISGVVAVWRGTRMHVQLTGAVDSSLALGTAHAIGHCVEQQLLAEPDVAQAVVHIEPA
jgi:cation diffusion facilitator family transporter